MRPSFSLHHLAASRLLRVMALLGWLLMTVSLPIAGGPNGSALNQRAEVSSMTMHTHDVAIAGQHAEHCCGTAAHPSCHCEAMCGSVLLPSVPVLFGPARLAAAHLSMRGVDAPAPDLIPPLRPPAA
jgi:hypothetical protein